MRASDGAFVRLIVVHLLSKGVGKGTRPIGLTNPLPRIYNKIRKKHVAEWRVKMARDYDGLVKGRRVEDVAWKHSVQAEAAQTTGEHTATSLIDLTKAFESAILAKAWENGIRTQYPLAILRLELELYCGPRRLTF